jgi:aminoglycoside phosphotransferase (APT) family kinase protein
MSTGKMHAGEVNIDAALVKRLLAAQFPRWADLPRSRQPCLKGGTTGPSALGST